MQKNEEKIIYIITNSFGSVVLLGNRKLSLLMRISIKIGSQRVHNILKKPPQTNTYFFSKIIGYWFLPHCVYTTRIDFFGNERVNSVSSFSYGALFIASIKKLR